ncbi:MAG: class I SAM-dependent methyltransferase [Caldilineaceae bacterium]|nr:class I SAM-dependent methyltransferase [Caldilineaceae bacterium]
MPRVQLWEIHEQPWCPPAVRDGATDCLNVIAIWGRQYAYIVPKLRYALQQTQARRVIDLCSGGGGPWLQLASRFQSGGELEPLEVLLTDLYPNLAAMQAAVKQSHEQIRYIATPVDATHLDAELEGFRTLFTAFHHFPPTVARAILQDAVNRQQGIGIFEQTSRKPLSILVMLLLPLIALIVVPFVRPFRLSRLFWTYLLPAIPLVLCIDGIVSCLRTYSASEMAELIAGVQGNSYIWDIGRVRSPLSPIGILYTIGYPAALGGDTDAVGTWPRVEAMK